MNIFISWSGDRSRAVAEFLEGWIKCVIQATKPWVSTRDIQRGAIWFNQINEVLKDTSFGIICLTQDNKDKPWILFEAGALSKGVTSTRVCTFLIDLKPSDVTDPLAQFNHTQPDEQSVFELVKTINQSLPENQLDIQVLHRVFSTYWPQFKIDFEKILNSTTPSEPAPPRDKDDILSEILESVRGQSKQIDKLEGNIKSMQIASDPHAAALARKRVVVYNTENSTITNRLRALNPHDLEEEVRRSLSVSGIVNAQE